MKLVVPFLLLIALLPLADARPWPEVDHGDYTVGPCRVAWTFWIDADTRLVACVVAGEEVVYYYDATTLLGHACVLRVAGETVYECSDGW